MLCLKLVRNLLIALTLLACFASTVECLTKANAIKIVGGQNTGIKSRPYLVSIRQRNRHFCGGSLIGKSYVLSAAHCFKNQNNNALTVHGGTSYLQGSRSMGRYRQVAKIFLPKAFNVNTLVNDVAVLKLRAPLTGKNIAVIPLARTHLKAGEKVHISGWGLSGENKRNLPNRVRTVKIPVISRAQCKAKYSGQAKLSKSMFCASKTGKDSCSGDSGGPVVYKKTLVGIVSWGFGCGRKQYPGVYTGVRAMRKFIIKCMKK